MKFSLLKTETECPVSIFGNLFNLGYDLHMNRSHHLTFTEALNDTLFSKNSIRLVNEQVLSYTESIFAGIPEIKTPLDLRSSHLQAINSEDSLAMVYPILKNIPTHILRLHFLILQKFNSLLSGYFPLVKLEGNGIETNRFLRCKTLIFHSVKMEFFYQVLDRFVCLFVFISFSFKERNEKKTKKERKTPEKVFLPFSFFAFSLFFFQFLFFCLLFSRLPFFCFLFFLFVLLFFFFFVQKN